MFKTVSTACLNPGFIPNPGDLLEFELEKGKPHGSDVSHPVTDSNQSRDALHPAPPRKKDGTINFTAINVTMATPHAPCDARRESDNCMLHLFSFFSSSTAETFSVPHPMQQTQHLLSSASNLSPSRCQPWGLNLLKILSPWASRG